MTALTGQVALVTGACGGIGQATVQALARDGAVVIATDLPDTHARVEPLLERLRGEGARVDFEPLDVTSAAQWERVMALARSRFGSLDILVNNAGLYAHGRIEDTDEAQMHRLFAVNLEGVVLGTAAAFRAMKHRPAQAPMAAIVNLSSIAGLIGSSNSALYGLTKGGVRLYSKASAIEAAQLGYRIRVNSVHPGIVDTDMAKAVAGAMRARGVAEGQETAAMAQGHPLGRLARADEIASGIRFLCSAEAAFITGTELVIDGGWTAR